MQIAAPALPTRAQSARPMPREAPVTIAYLISPVRRLLLNHGAETSIANNDPEWVRSRPSKRRSIMRLKNKVAIITGGAQDMGEGEVRLFAAEGAKVIVADILASDAEKVAADIRAGDAEATAAKIDVANEAEWINLIAKAVATCGRLDILVNNAGSRVARLATKMD
jgi:hypothetical protein